MNKFIPSLNFRVRSELGMILVSVMIMAFHGLIVFGFWNKPAFEFLVALRMAHFFVGLICFIAILRLHRRWNLRLAKIFFSILVVPLYAVAWFNHAAMTQSQDLWIPFKGIYIIVVGLTAIAPAGYLLNFFFLIGFAVEVIVIWYVLDIPHHPNMILSGEPYYILGTSAACLLLLFSRYQDEEKIRLLVAEKTKGEFAKNLARVMLTIRDRMNTPLQNINFLIYLIKKSPQMTPFETSALENSVQNIINTNRQFNRLEALIDWEGKNLMSDEEIDAWLSTLDLKAQSAETKKT